MKRRIYVLFVFPNTNTVHFNRFFCNCNYKNMMNTQVETSLFSFSHGEKGKR